MTIGISEDNPQHRFGPFRLVVGERLIERDGVRVDLGGRAMDILIALVGAHNQTISKKRLIALVWPDAVVEEGSLRFHMAGLRKALAILPPCPVAATAS